MSNLDDEEAGCALIIILVFVVFFFGIVIQVNNIATKVNEIHKQVVPAKAVPVETVPIYE